MTWYSPIRLLLFVMALFLCQSCRTSRSVWRDSIALHSSRLDLYDTVTLQLSRIPSLSIPFSYFSGKNRGPQGDPLIANEADPQTIYARIVRHLSAAAADTAASASQVTTTATAPATSRPISRTRHTDWGQLAIWLLCLVMVLAWARTAARSRHP